MIWITWPGDFFYALMLIVNLNHAKVIPSVTFQLFCSVVMHLPKLILIMPAID